MKKLFTLLLVALTAFAIGGCDDDDNNVISYYYYDIEPTAPQGVTSITGDNSVLVMWDGLYDVDVYEYVVYRSFDAIENYSAIGFVDPYPRPTDNVYSYTDNTPDNGETYYYAVAAVDSAGQSSELSWENVFDTPRPDGEVVLYSNSISPDLSGFEFFTHERVVDTSSFADVYVDSIGGVFYLNAGNLYFIYGLIQDVGNAYYFNNFIGYAPTDGWSDLGYVEIIEGHSYVIYTDDNHFALLTAVTINPSGSITFGWAYQTEADNPELSPGPDGDNPRIVRTSKKSISLD